MSAQTDHQVNTKAELPLKPEQAEWLKSKIRDIPDFPKPGILFKDVTTLWKEKDAFAFVTEALAQKSKSLKPDVIAGIEARGFIVGSAVAYMLGLGFVPIRKPGKLPYVVERVTYDLEYGTDTIEVHADALEKGQRVVLLDDLLATGGTAGGAIQLLEKIGGTVVGTGFIVELGFLNGRNRLTTQSDIFSLISY